MILLAKIIIAVTISLLAAIVAYAMWGINNSCSEVLIRLHKKEMEGLKK